MEQENQNQATTTTLVAQSPKSNETALVFDSIEHFENAQRMCKCLAQANMLPVHFRGADNMGNCMIALEIAQRGKLPIMEIFQNLIVVNGRTSWYSTYLIGRVNSCGRFTTLKWESENDGTSAWRMRAKAVEIATGEELVGSWVSLEMAAKEHWGAKWNTMPEQMLRYRSASFWVRTYAPDIAMGIKDQYEVEDAVAEDVTNAQSNAEKRDAATAAIMGAIGNKAGKQKKEIEAEDVTPVDEKQEQDPKPIVSVVVEQSEDDRQKKYQQTLATAKKNLGIETKLDFESSEQ